MRGTTALGALALLLGACGGGTQYLIEGGGVAAGADTYIDVAPREDGSQQVHVEVRHLPPPERLGLDLATYAVWIAPSGASPRRAGRLTYDRDTRAGVLTLVTRHRRFRLLVTAEPWPVLESPSPVVVVDQDVSG